MVRINTEPTIIATAMFRASFTILNFKRALFRCGRTLLFATFFLFVGSSSQADSERGRRIYRENCVPCHGQSGKGDGLGAKTLPVRPADHTNAKAMKSRTDAFLRDVIAKGGSAMGLSSFMPAWEGILKDEQIQDLVDYIRTLARAQ